MPEAEAPAFKRGEYVTEERGAGVVLEWLFDRQVVIARSLPSSHHTSREKVDIWAESCIEVIRNWPANKPFLIINDATNSGYSPYAARRAEDIVKAYPPGARGRLAMVIPGGPLYFVMRFAAERMVKTHLKTLEFAIFKIYDDALEWVAEKIRV